MILVIGENSVWQRTVLLEKVELDSVNRAKSVSTFSSGKGVNVVRALKVTNSKGFLLGYAGGTIGEIFTKLLEEEGMALCLTNVKNETRICTTLIEEEIIHGTRRVTEIVEPAPLISAEESEEFFKTFTKYLEKASVLSVSGTAVRGENPFVYKKAIEMAKKLGIIAILDSHGREAEEAVKGKPDVLKINLDEFIKLIESDERYRDRVIKSNQTGSWKERLGNQRMRFNAYREFTDITGIKWLIITMGKEGAEAFDGKKFYYVETPKIEVINSIGSGDSFTAGVASVIEEYILDNTPNKIATTFIGLENIPISEALKRGAAMGTANCLNLMPGLIEKSDYQAMLEKIKVKTISF